MTRKEILDLLMILSAVESWSFSVDKPLPDYLHENLVNAAEVLRKELGVEEQ